MHGTSPHAQLHNAGCIQYLAQHCCSYSLPSLAPNAVHHHALQIGTHQARAALTIDGVQYQLGDFIVRVRSLLSMS